VADALFLRPEGQQNIDQNSNYQDRNPTAGSKGGQ